MHRRAELLKRILLVLIILIATQGDAAERAKLTLGYSSTGPTGVGLWVAKDIGAFDKYGVEPNLVFISSGPVMVPALIGGDVQARRRRGERGDCGGARRRSDRLCGEPRQPSLSSTLGSP